MITVNQQYGTCSSNLIKLQETWLAPFRLNGSYLRRRVSAPGKCPTPECVANGTDDNAPHNPSCAKGTHISVRCVPWAVGPNGARAARYGANPVVWGAGPGDRSYSSNCPVARKGVPPCRGSHLIVPGCARSSLGGVSVEVSSGSAISDCPTGMDFWINENCVKLKFFETCAKDFREKVKSS